jgi:hypothetical protein
LCATFALSVFLLLLILFDMTGALSPDTLRAVWRAALAALLACIMVATPFYLFYVALCADGACPLAGETRPRFASDSRHKAHAQALARCAARWAPPPAWRPRCACSGRRATASAATASRQLQPPPVRFRALRSRPLPAQLCVRRARALLPLCS